MQNYYLHYHSSPGMTPNLLRRYRHPQGPLAIAAKGSQLELYRLLEHDLTFHRKYSFHATIESIQVLPSRLHKHDYLWILDEKGRFCCWHPQSIDLVNNTVLWDQFEKGNSQEAVFSGVNWQFQGSSTVGTIFYAKNHIFVLLHFNITEKGVYIDQRNIIKYPLPGFKYRFCNWIKHSQSLFLVGFVVQQEGKTALCVYDLEKGLGVCAQSLQWRFQKINLLQFYSTVPGEVLIVTYNEVSLHNYKSNSPLRNYRTRGNYGQGFCLGDGYYGHIGQQLVVFSRDNLRTYGQVKAYNCTASFSNLCFIHCQILGQIEGDGTLIVLQTYEGDVYMLRLFEKTFSIAKIFASIGTILEMCCLKSDRLLAVVTQQAANFHVSLLERQCQVEIKEENRLIDAQAEKMMVVNGGLFIILCSSASNDVFRLSRNQKYQFYFSLPEGNLLAAEGQFIAYEDAIYEIDYQCLALAPLVEKKLLLVEITREVIYFLDYQGNLQCFEDKNDAAAVILTDRQNDYCWGLFQRTNTLLTANLLQPKQIRIISAEQERQLSIKGHTLVTSLCSIYYKKSRIEYDDRVLIGYADGQIHMHSLSNQSLHSIYMFEHYGSAPVSFCACGDAVLANYTNKQYLIMSSRDQYQFINVNLSHSSTFIHLIGFLQRSGELCIASNTLLQKVSLSTIKDSYRLQNSNNFRITKLQEWNEAIPLLLNLEDRLLIAGNRCLKLLKLQNYKIMRTYYHHLKEIINVSEIKLGIIICGVDLQQKEHIIVLSEQLQQICKFQLHTKKPMRCMKVIQGQNQFFLGYDDSITQYKITNTLQLQVVMGKKIQLDAYHIALCDSSILVNDPFRSLAVLEKKESINSLGIYPPPYKVTHSVFIGTDILYIDERGYITILTGRMQQLIIDQVFKFTKICSFYVGKEITSIYECGDAVYYSTAEGKMGVIRQISRDDFDSLKKIETESLLQMDQRLGFSYWQWRQRAPAHQRIIDGQIFSQHQYLRQNFK